MIHSAINIAKTLLTLSNPEYGDIISNLKLQKLLYYSQGLHIALSGEALFNDNIVAWQYGPVVENVYREFKVYGSGAIPVPENFDNSYLSDDQLEILKDVYGVFGQFSALKLMEMTHSEMPWKSTPINGIISTQTLLSHFSTLVKNG
jgi:uncharacterized phage-associated protein